MSTNKPQRISKSDLENELKRTKQEVQKGTPERILQRTPINDRKTGDSHSSDRVLHVGIALTGSSQPHIYLSSQPIRLNTPTVSGQVCNTHPHSLGVKTHRGDPHYSKGDMKFSKFLSECWRLVRLLDAFFRSILPRTSVRGLVAALKLIFEIEALRVRSPPLLIGLFLLFKFMEPV